MSRYPDLPASATELEEEVLARWREEETFARSLEQTAGGEPFVFFEGPPTANGRPGIHHVFSRTIKDAVARFRTMQGRYVPRIAGWDTHGLPVEIEAEKRLGISGKPEIEKVGIARFNEVCRESVLTYTEEWERFSARIGYWLDYSRPYVTYHADYIESIWWSLKQIADRGLVYRGHKILPYCPRCGTGLSSHEVALGLPGRAGPVALLHAAAAWTRRGGRRAGVPGVDDDAVDAGLQRGAGGEPGAGVRGGGARGAAAACWRARRVEALFGEEAEVLRTFPASELRGAALPAALRLGGGRATRGGGGSARWRVGPGGLRLGGGRHGDRAHVARRSARTTTRWAQEQGLPILQPVDDRGRLRRSSRWWAAAS